MSHYYGWRAAFIGAGLPGLILAIVLLLTVREPARTSGVRLSAPLGESLAFLASQKTYMIVLVGFCITSFTNYATSVWIPPFLARVHHLSPADIGTYAGTFKGLFGIAGTLAGGFVTTHLTKRDDRWLLWAPAIMSGLAGPIFALCMLTTSFPVMLGAMGAFSFCVGFHLGPIFSVAQTVARPSVRAFRSGITSFDGHAGRPRAGTACRWRAQRRLEGYLWRRCHPVFPAIRRRDLDPGRGDLPHRDTVHP